jgi:hypothetical protein
MSTGGTRAGDGKQLTIGGVRYTRGLGVHAYSDVRYSLGGSFSRFQADIGVDDAVGKGGSVVFEVFGDGVQLFHSGQLRGSDSRRSIDINVAGINELRLVVADAGNGIKKDHADWANARLIPRQMANDIWINFQPDWAPVPTWHLKDAGHAFGDRGNGFSYGWSQSHTDMANDRNRNSDQRLDTGIQFRPGATWEMEVANGTYAVTVIIGDSKSKSTNSLNVEGLTYWSGMTLPKNQFAEMTRAVTVADGRLTLEGGSLPRTNTVLAYLEVIPLGMSAGIFPYTQMQAPAVAAASSIGLAVTPELNSSVTGTIVPPENGLQSKATVGVHRHGAPLVRQAYSPSVVSTTEIATVDMLLEDGTPGTPREPGATRGTPLPRRSFEVFDEVFETLGSGSQETWLDVSR